MIAAADADVLGLCLDGLADVSVALVVAADWRIISGAFSGPVKAFLLAFPERINPGCQALWVFLSAFFPLFRGPFVLGNVVVVENHDVIVRIEFPAILEPRQFFEFLVFDDLLAAENQAIELLMASDEKEIVVELPSGFNNLISRGELLIGRRTVSGRGLTENANCARPGWNPDGVVTPLLRTTTGEIVLIIGLCGRVTFDRGNDGNFPISIL